MNLCPDLGCSSKYIFQSVVEKNKADIIRTHCITPQSGLLGLIALKIAEKRRKVTFIGEFEILDRSFYRGISFDLEPFNLFLDPKITCIKGIGFEYSWTIEMYSNYWVCNFSNMEDLIHFRIPGMTYIAIDAVDSMIEYCGFPAEPYPKLRTESLTDISIIT